MLILKYLFLALLAVFTAFHLYGSWVENTKIRNITKPFLLPLIIAYYLVSCVGADVKISVLLVCALAASWLGDVLLMPKGNKWFVFGGISFMLTHFLLVAVFAFKVNSGSILWWLVAAAAVVYYGISAVIIHTLTPSTPKMMLAPMYIYLLCNSTMNLFSLMLLTASGSPASVIAYIGAVLFFISDCTLFLVRYHKNKDLVFKRHFTVMLTYVLGELLIAQGVFMLG